MFSNFFALPYAKVRTITLARRQAFETFGSKHPACRRAGFVISIRVAIR
jgi:hypothetical protein